MSDNIPETWETVSLSELGEWRGGGTPSKAVSAYWNGSIPWVSPKDMKTDSIIDAEDHITEEAVERSATSLIPDGAVLMVTRSGILAHSFPVAVTKTSVALNQDLKSLIPHEGIDGEFVAWALRRYSQDILAKCSKHGTTVHSIETPRLQQFEIPLAPTNEQRRIAERIDELFSQIKAGEQALAGAQKLLERYRQSILHAAVTGELTREWRELHEGELESGEALLERILQARREAWEEAALAKMRARGKPPNDDRWRQSYKEPEPPDTTDLVDLPEGWVWANLDQVAWHSSYGTSEKCIAQQNGPLVLRIPNVRASTLVLEDLKYAQNDLGLEAADTIAPGDMLVIRTNGSLDLLGHAVVVDSPMPAATYYASYLIRFRLVPVRSLWRWVTVVWRSEPVRRAITEQAATSAGQYNISQTKLASIAIPIPPPQELAAATELAESLTEAASRAEREASAEAYRAARLRQSVLSFAYSGKLVPQDPADEPASMLLQRIQEERAAASQDASRRRGGRPLKKGEPAMVKTRKEIKSTHLRDIIHANNGGMAADALWKASELDIDDFYKQLRDEVAAGYLRAERDSGTSRIVCQ